MVSLSDARLSLAKAAIASACLDALPDAMLGRVQLRDEQRLTLARALRAMQRFSGCLIGEDVGRGKTFVALAIARRWTRPLVIVPAALRSTWRDACERAEVECVLESHEALSRGSVPAAAYDGIVVDESHHFRTSTTCRYAALVKLASTAPIVLLSATPLQNRRRDLAAQVALFFGEGAFALDGEALSRFVIRGGDDDPSLPAVRSPEWLAVDADDEVVLRAIVSVEADARPLDGGDGGALRMIGLVRAWASSRAALQSTLRTRRRIATAIEQGLEAGRVPTRREARAWHNIDNSIQLGFPALLMRSEVPNDSVERLRAEVLDDQRSLDRIESVLHMSANPDCARIDALRRLREEHPTTRIIAFSEFASTVSAFFAAMRTDSGVGLLISSEARIASGRITRDELLARFAPIAQRARFRPAHESITLLLATDLLSEGVNLQDASIVVHLDLPWNPARLAQRLGRVRRPGGASEVRSWLMPPPASAALLLNIDARLRHKLNVAEQIVGEGLDVFPGLPPLSRVAALDIAVSSMRHMTQDANAEAEGAFLGQLARWRSRAPIRQRPAFRHCVVGGVTCTTTGWLAALSDGHVVCSTAGRVSTSPSLARRLVEVANGQSQHVPLAERRQILRVVDAWIDAEQLTVLSGLGGTVGPLVRQVSQWMDAVARTLPRHRRAEGLSVVSRVREVLECPLPLGVQQLLAGCASQSRGGETNSLQSLQMAATIIDEYRARRATSTRTVARPVAIIVFGSASSL